MRIIGQIRYRSFTKLFEERRGYVSGEVIASGANGVLSSV
jgi:hypothetical protein